MPLPLSSIDPPATARRLPELYYLQNFRMALADLGVRHAPLLSDEERDFLARFTELPQPSQCLLTRLLMRKGPVFRRDTLGYPEVGDVDQALARLAAQAWIDTDPAMTVVELSALLNRMEWRRIFGGSGVRRIGEVESPQLALALPNETPELRPLSAWHPQLRGAGVRVRVDSLAQRIQWLYFGNDHQDWAEFVLRDLGVLRYEQVPFDERSSAFRHRRDIEEFYRLNDCRARLASGEPPATVLPDAQRPVDTTDWLGARFGRLLLRLGEAFDREGQHGPAFDAYRASDTHAARIRLMRLYERCDMPAAARDEASALLHMPCSEADREAIDRILLRARRRLGDQVSRRTSAVRPAEMALCIPDRTAEIKVEHQVCELLSAEEHPAFYVENGLFASLFGLLCWEAIFAPLPGAFFHSFQSAPADLHAPEFQSRRDALFRDCLATLDSGDYATLLQRRYREKAGIHNPFVRWSRLRPQILTLALQCIPAAHLKRVFARMLEDLATHCSGLPDLVQFWPAEQRYQLIEIKAPGDRLQHHQRRWMEFFAVNGIPAVVCKVKWSGVAYDVRQPGGT